MKKYFLNYDMLAKKWIIFFIVLFTSISFCFAGEPTVINESVGLKPILSMEKVSGDNQEGCVRSALMEPLIVKVVDKNGTGVIGASINFSVVGEGATLSKINTETDPNGIAQTIVNIGEVGGDVTVTAKANDLEIESGSPQIFTVKALKHEWGAEKKNSRKLPESFQNFMNSFARKMGIKFKPKAEVFLAEKKRDCCSYVGGDFIIIEDGEEQSEGGFDVNIEGKDVPFPGAAIPERDIELSLKIARLQLKITAGLYWNFNTTLKGSAGFRRNLCKKTNSDCAFWSLGTNAALSIKPKFTIKGCASVFGFDFCPDLDSENIATASVSAGLRGSAGWNREDCKDKLDASISIGDITIKASLKLDNIIPGGRSVSLSYPVSGFTLF